MQTLVTVAAPVGQRIDCCKYIIVLVKKFISERGIKVSQFIIGKFFRFQRLPLNVRCWPLDIFTVARNDFFDRLYKRLYSSRISTSAIFFKRKFC